MSEVLSDFLRALRASAVRVSTAEGIDAAAAVDCVGVADRALLKLALSQVLAKTGDDKTRFGVCFDQFFRYEDLRSSESGEGSPAAANESPDSGAAGPSGSGDEGSGTGPGALLQLLEAGDRAALQLVLAAAARSARVQEIRLFTQRGMYTRRILEQMGIVELEQAITRFELAGDETRANRTRLRRAELIEQVRTLVDRQILLFAANAGTRLREEILQQVPLARAERSDFKLMQLLVRKLAKRLVALHSRRRKVADRGKLDVRHTIRRNIEYDGLLFDVVWKRKKIERPKVVAVCDVSGSVATIARFLLLFLYSVSEVLPKVRAFAFSNQLAEITDLFAEKPAEDAIAETLQRHGWGSTDYGRALAELETLALADIDHHTTVLVLGDARSNYGDPGQASLRRIHDRARRVIWLNPEPRSFWNTGDSEMRRLGAACDRVESCRSLQQLQRIVSDLLRTAV